MFELSTGLLVLTTYTKDYDLGELARKHKQATTKFGCFANANCAATGVIGDHFQLTRGQPVPARNST